MRQPIEFRRVQFAVAAAAVSLLVNSGCWSSERDRPRVDDGPKAVDYFSDPDMIDLAEATKSEDLDAIDKLVAKGVDVNKKGKYGVTPLLFTLKCKKLASFKRLLEHGADPNVQNARGDAPISVAAEIRESSEWLELALNHKGDPNLVDPKGVFKFQNDRTPLFMAIDVRSLRNLELLLAAGANPDHQDASQDTPAMYAASSRWYPGVYRLLKAGADVQLRDEHGHDLAFYCFVELIDQKDFPKLYEHRERVLAILKAKGVNLAEAKRLADKHMGRNKGGAT